MVVLFPIVVIVACGRPTYEPQKPTGTTPESSVAFDTWTDDFLAEYWRAHPVTATSMGIHAHDDRLPSYTEEERDAREKVLEDQLRELEQLGDLGDEDARLDARIAEAAIREELFGLRELRRWQHDPRSYLSMVSYGVASLVDRQFAPLEERLQSLTARLAAAVEVFDVAKNQLDKVPRLWCELAVRDAAGLIDYFENHLPAALAAQNIEQADGAIVQRFRHQLGVTGAALSEFHGWLEKDLMPRATGDFSLGRERFETLLKLSEHIGESADELKEMNEEAIARYTQWVATEAAKIDPDKTPAEVMASITGDHPSPQQLLPTARKFVLQAREMVVAKDILTLPGDSLPTVRETPPYARMGFASMDTPGPFETEATEAYYNITNVDPQWDAEKKQQHLSYFNYPGLLGISVHEVMPGHYVQLLVRPEIPGRIRKVFSTGSFVEGWAHYTEEMMVDEGLGEGDPKIRLGQLRRALQRHARWYAAIAIHVDRKPIEEVAKRFEEIAFFAPFPALRETQRATYNPTYLYYAYGRMAIQKLRDEVKQARGSEFTLRSFHDELLRLGVPLSFAREVMLADDE